MAAYPPIIGDPFSRVKYAQGCREVPQTITMAAIALLVGDIDQRPFPFNMNPFSQSLPTFYLGWQAIRLASIQLNKVSLTPIR